MNQLILQSVVLGILQGGLYALMAIGLSLVFGVLRVVNFAHGEFAMLGSYGAYFAVSKMGLPAPLAMVAAALVGGLAGLLTNSFVLGPIYGSKIERKGEYTIVATFVLSQLVIAAATVLFSTTYRKLPGLWNTNLNFFDTIFVSGNRIAAFGMSMVLVALVFWIVYRTNLGRAWRALTQNQLGAAVVGIDVKRYATYAFVVSGALAGVAASLLAPLLFVFPSSGVVTLAKAFIVVIIGGMGSIGGALVAGLLLGIIETLGTIWGESGYTDAYGFTLMILVLLWRPQGLFGQKERMV